VVFGLCRYGFVAFTKQPGAWFAVCSEQPGGLDCRVCTEQPGAWFLACSEQPGGLDLSVCRAARRLGLYLADKHSATRVTVSTEQPGGLVLVQLRVFGLAYSQHLQYYIVRICF
jgi:invasion protein IalB